MAGKQVTGGDGLSANLAGMTKNQLYEIMSQMKTLIEQNQQQARQILIQNPQLTKALFQAQIMLGMVQPPQVIPSMQAPKSEQPESTQPIQQQHTQDVHSLQNQMGIQDQTGAFRTQPPTMRMQQQNVTSFSHQAQTMAMPTHQTQQQPKGHLTPQVPFTSLSQSSQHQSIPQSTLHSAPQPTPLQQPQMSTASSQLQQPLQTPGISHMTLQHPNPPQPRLPSMPNYHQQYAGFQPHTNPQHLTQPLYHAGTNTGPSFPHGQPPLPSHPPPPPQPQYQAGGQQHFGTELNNQGGNSMQVDRGSSWMSGSSENPTVTQLPGPPSSSAPAQTGSSSQPARPAQMSPEMEKALLQQVMSLTQEQINLLPPEQRNQVLQLQQMLRQ